MRLSGRKPSASTRRFTYPPRFVLLGLIGANLAVAVVQLLLQGYDPAVTREYLALSERGLKNAFAWQFFTAIFLHSGPWHFAGNMLIFYLLGRDVELIVGQRHFLFLYLAGAIGGELGHLFLMPSETVLLAASGGVAAVVIAYATILPELDLISFPIGSRTARLKAKHFGAIVVAIAVLALLVDRGGTVTHSCYLGGCVIGWLYTHLLGFGQPSYFQRMLRQRRAEADRLRRMGVDQYIAEEIDPLLEKISREGLESLTRIERRKLAQAREKFGDRSTTA